MKTADAIRLAEAVQHRQLVSFCYKNVQRIVQPHIIGVTSEQHVAMSGWQISGTGRGWRLFRVAEMSRLKITGETFHRFASGYNPDDPAFREVIVQL